MPPRKPKQTTERALTMGAHGQPVNVANSAERSIWEFFHAEDSHRVQVRSPDSARKLSPYFAAINLYQSLIAAFPLITYKKSADDSRERDTSHPAYPILRYRPNESMPSAVWMSRVVRELFDDGNSIHLIQRAGTGGDVLNLFPVDPDDVEQIIVDEEFRKLYVIDGQFYGSEEVLHFIHHSKDGIVGEPLLKWAGESLGVAAQVQDAASSYYRNAVRTPIYVKTIGAVNSETRKSLEEQFGTKHGGARNSGKTPVLMGAEVAAFPSTNATDAQLLEAMGGSVGEIARWFQLSPIALGDYSQAHYASLAADNVYLYQRSLAPFLAPIEQELNLKLFGLESDNYCEFLVDGLLRGDPAEAATVLNTQLLNGSLLVNEARALANRGKIAGGDEPIRPGNMVPAHTPDPTPEPAPTTADQQPADVPATDAPVAEAPVANSGLNGAQIASILAIVDKVATKAYPAETAIALIAASFPLIDSATITSIVTSVANYTPPPAPQGTPNDAPSTLAV